MIPGTKSRRQNCAVCPLIRMFHYKTRHLIFSGWLHHHDHILFFSNSFPKPVLLETVSSLHSVCTQQPFPFPFPSVAPPPPGHLQSCEAHPSANDPEPERRPREDPGGPSGRAAAGHPIGGGGRPF